MENPAYNIYCDESGIDNPQNKVMVIGALFLKRNSVHEIKRKIQEIREKHSIKGELKWVKTSALILPFYEELFSYLFTLPATTLTFRCITIEKDKVDYKKYHNEDKELAFYKFYYFLLKNNLSPKKYYHILLDFKPTKNKNSVRRLGDFLSFVSPNSNNIKHIQAYPSNENVFIQITDILTGAVLYSRNKRIGSKNKEKLTEIIAKSIKKDNLDFCSTLLASKFNIFCLNLDRK